MAIDESKWKLIAPGYNSVLRGKGFFVSYNPNTNSSEAVRSYNQIGAMVDGLPADGRAETALVSSKGLYYILDGDFREAYQDVVDKGFDACLKVFRANKKHRSRWSSDGAV